MILASLLEGARIITWRGALFPKPLIHCPNYRARLPRDAKEKPLRHRAALERTQLGVIMTGMGMMALRGCWRCATVGPHHCPGRVQLCCLRHAKEAIARGRRCHRSPATHRRHSLEDGWELTLGCAGPQVSTLMLP